MLTGDMSTCQQWWGNTSSKHWLEIARTKCDYSLQEFDYSWEGGYVLMVLFFWKESECVVGGVEIGFAAMLVLFSCVKVNSV